MSTQTSQLVGNLSKIYNVKLQLKNVLQTNSDIFEDYPAIAESLIGEGGEIPAGYTYVSGTSYISTNGSHDVSSYAYAYVNVEGGGSDPEVKVDPWYDATGVVDMIMNEESTADYVRTDLAANFSVTMDGNEESVFAVEWDFYVGVDTGELDQYDNPIYEQKKVHVIVSSNDEHGELNIAIDIAQDLEDYPDLYENIYPILENATLTESEDPSNDGYDYLLEGDIYAWNLNDNNAPVQEITENGFYLNDGCLGFDVNTVPEMTSGTFFVQPNDDIATDCGDYFSDIGIIQYMIFDTSDPEYVPPSKSYNYELREGVYTHTTDAGVIIKNGQPIYVTFDSLVNNSATIWREEVVNGVESGTWVQCTVDGKETISNNDKFGNPFLNFYFYDDGYETHLYSNGVDLGVVEELETEPGE